jgi:hypothetical protein
MPALGDNPRSDTHLSSPTACSANANAAKRCRCRVPIGSVSMREAFLTYEASCGPNGLVSILLLAIVSRRQGAVADDLQAAADHAEILLGIKICKHQYDALMAVHDYLMHGGVIWS